MSGVQQHPDVIVGRPPGSSLPVVVLRSAVFVTVIEQGPTCNKKPQRCKPPRAKLCDDPEQPEISWKVTTLRPIDCAQVPSRAKGPPPVPPTGRARSPPPTVTLDEDDLDVDPDYHPDGDVPDGDDLDVDDPNGDNPDVNHPHLDNQDVADPDYHPDGDVLDGDVPDYYPDGAVSDEDDPDVEAAKDGDGETRTNHVRAWTSQEPFLTASLYLDGEAAKGGKAAEDGDGWQEGEQSEAALGYPCCFCDDTCPSSAALMTHIKNDHSKQYRCDQCQEILSSFSAFSDHQVSVHDERRPLQCRHCSARFATMHQFRRHLDTHRPAARATCEECGKSFTRADYLRIHQRLHDKSAPKHVCKHCFNTFSTVSNLNAHMRIHTGEIHRCQRCGMIFTRADRLKKHYAKSHGQPCPPAGRRRRKGSSSPSRTAKRPAPKDSEGLVEGL